MFDIGGWLGSGVKSGISMPGLGGVVPGIASTATQPNWWQSLIGTGLDVYKTQTAANIASKQISANQYPTVIGQNGQLSGTANAMPSNWPGAISTGISGSVLTIGGILLVLLLVFAVMGRK